MSNKRDTATILKLQEENAELRRKLDEAEETLTAIREGEVDAIVVSGDGGDRVFSLTGAEQVYRLIVETMKEAALTVALDGTILFCNRQFEQFVGLPQEKILGHALLEFVAPEQSSTIPDLIARSVTQSVKGRLVFQTEGRPPVPAHISANVLNQQDGVSVCIVATDLTELEKSTDRRQAEEALRAARDQLEERVQERTAELNRAVNGLRIEIERRQQAEAGLQRTNQVLQMLSDCNQAIVRIEDERQMMNEICRIIVEVGRYRLAWVGLAENDEYKTVRPVASTGFESGYLESARITWADTERGRGPTGTVIRTGRVQFGRDFLSDPSLAPWRESAIRRGFRSSIALPLREGSSVFGALTIYAATEDAFGESQVKILRELGDDLAFGIVALRTQSALRESRDLLRALAGELTLTEQRERQRMAQILHDHIQQLLVAAKYRVLSLSEPGDDPVKEGTKEVEELLNQCISASRTLTADLSPPVLQEGGLAASLKWLAEWMVERHGLSVELALGDEISPVLQDVKVLLFEATRELLFNVVKHAQVKSAAVSLRSVNDDELQVAVSDNGIGFDPDTVSMGRATGSGFGLFSIRERMRLIGGQLNISSKPGEGSRFTLTISRAASLAPYIGHVPVTDRSTELE